MNKQELLALIALGESETVEFKKTTSELKESVISLVAMLNKKGHGIVLFGVVV